MALSKQKNKIIIIYFFSSLLATLRVFTAPSMSLHMREKEKKRFETYFKIPTLLAGRGVTTQTPSSSSNNNNNTNNNSSSNNISNNNTNKINSRTQSQKKSTAFNIKQQKVEFF